MTGQLARGAGQSPAIQGRVRSPNLDAARVTAIVRIIERLPGKPSWEVVMAAVEERLNSRYTRQTLFAHPAIRLAYQERKAGVRARAGERPLSARARAAAAQTARLRAELAEVKQREELLLERIALWMYNAHAHGISTALLDAPLVRLGS